MQITDPVAQNIAKAYQSPDALEADLLVTARRPLKERVFASYYANPGSSPDQKHPIRNWRGHITRTERANQTPVPTWYDSDSETISTIPVMKEGMTAFLITGDDSRNKVQTMPGGGYAPVKIELPADWDTLTQSLGYKPLSNYYISE